MQRWSCAAQGWDPPLPLGCGHRTHILCSDWDISFLVLSAGQEDRPYLDWVGMGYRGA